MMTVNSLNYLDDTFEFLNLTLSSRKEFLNAEFKLQEHPISWKTFFGDHSHDNFKVLSPTSVVKIMEAGLKLSVGKVLAEPVKHYVPRRLQQLCANETEIIFRPETVMDLGERSVIVCGEPGMGKSTLVTHLSKATKEAHPHLWVISIALNDHTQLFAERKHEDATGFLLAAAKIETPLEQSMFRHSLEVTGNVVVMLDGFDEVAPRYVDHCSLLLSNLLSTKAKKVLITSRLSVKDKLGCRLLTPVRLCPFSEEDQKCFLKRHFKDARALALQSGKKVLPELELAGFVNQLFEMTLSSMKDRGTDFMGVPLQTQMMAEVFVDHVTSPAETLTLPKTLDLLQLLEKFVEKKLEIYVQNKLKIKSSDTNYKMHVDNYRMMYTTFHMKFALHAMLSKSYVKDIQSRSSIGELSDLLQNVSSGEDKTGFINSITNGKPRFVHRVFGEYFVAMWFSDHLSEYARFIRETNSRNFVGDPTVTRLLCDLMLARNCPLHIAVLNGDVDKVNALLKAGADVNARDKAGRTSLHLITTSGSESFSGKKEQIEILDLLMNIPGINVNIKDIELIKGTPLQHAYMNRHWVMMDKLLTHHVDVGCLNNTTFDYQGELYILKNDLHMLLAFCLDKRPDLYNERTLHYIKRLGSSEGNGLLAAACFYGSLRTVKMLIDRGYHVNGTAQSTSHDTKLIQSVRFPPLYRSAEGGNLEVVKLLVAQARITFYPPNGRQNSFGFTDFLNRKAGNEGRTALHKACGYGHTEIAAFLIENGADVTIRNDDGRTCLHHAAFSVKNQPDLIRKILGRLSAAELPTYVNLGDDDGHTALHSAARGGSLETVKVLVSAGGKMSFDDNRVTPLHHAAWNGPLGVVKYLVTAFGGEGDGDGCKWIDSRDDRGRSALNVAASEGHEDVVSYLTEQGADTGGPVEGMDSSQEVSTGED